MKIYRIYIENVCGIDYYGEICEDFFESFTVIEAKGVIIEIIAKATPDTKQRIINFSRYLCCDNNQDEVFITETDCKAYKIGQSGIVFSEV